VSEPSCRGVPFSKSPDLEIRALFYATATLSAWLSPGALAPCSASLSPISAFVLFFFEKWVSVGKER
jgi:hypothetical protein